MLHAMYEIDTGRLHQLNDTPVLPPEGFGIAEVGPFGLDGWDVSDFVIAGGEAVLQPVEGRREAVEAGRAREGFMADGPARLDEHEAEIEDMTLLLAEMVGGGPGTAEEG